MNRATLPNQPTIDRTTERTDTEMHTETGPINDGGEIRVTTSQAHVESPNGETSAFAVGDAVRVTKFVPLFDTTSDAAAAEATDTLGGREGTVMAAFWLAEQDEFAYSVELDVGRIEISPAGIVMNYQWPLLERELEAVAE